MPNPLPQKRTDRHNNPFACTVDIAKQAKLVEGKDYTVGDPFTVGSSLYHTARLLGNPIDLCITIVDRIGFYTKGGARRWDYIAIPAFIWDGLNKIERIKVIEFMYKNEGGTELKPLFEKALNGIT